MNDNNAHEQNPDTPAAVPGLRGAGGHSPHGDLNLVLMVNTARLLMETLQCLLEIKVKNTSTDPKDTFELEVRPVGRIVPAGSGKQARISPSKERTFRFELELPGGKASPRRSAGDALIAIEVLVRSATEGTFRFRTEFSMPVLPFSEDDRGFRLNIKNLINQSEKGGWGSINSVDLRGLSEIVERQERFNIPTLILQPRTENWIPVELDFVDFKPVPPPSPPNFPTLFRATALDTGSERALHILTGDAVVIGRSRREADVVAWFFPRTPEHDAASAMVSGRHCELRLGQELVVRHLSKSNPTELDAIQVVDCLSVPLSQPSLLCLAGCFEARITPIPRAPMAPSVLRQCELLLDRDARERWAWSERTGVGGLLIEAMPGQPAVERFLWVLSRVFFPPEPPMGKSSAQHRLILLSLKPLAIEATEEKGPPFLVNGLVTSACKLHALAENDTVRLGIHDWRIGAFQRAADIAVST